MTVEPGKNFEGQKGFPTPNDTPETSACRTFRVPASDEWLGVLMAAVEVLREDWAWYNWGSMSIDEVTQAWNDIIIASYEESLTGGCPATMTDTPYWDTDEDVDDEMPLDDQPWYGHVADAATAPTDLTFVEDATIWAFSGLIVLSLGAAGIAPALAFRTAAEKFVLSYKNDSAGSVIRFFVDGVKIYQGTDTGGGEVTSFTAVGDPEEETHQIYMTAEIS